MKPFLLGGEPIRAGEGHPVVNPYTGQTIAEVAFAEEEHLKQALRESEIVFQQTKRESRAARARVLNKAADLLRSHREELAGLIVSEAGKPRTLAEAEVQRAEVTFRIGVQEALVEPGELLAADASTTGAGLKASVFYRPIGGILGVTPFNFPLNLVAHKVVPCLATGNVMIVKPAPATPLTALRLHELLLEAGMPAGQIQLLPFHHDHIDWFLDDPRVRMLSFTGSAEVGWQLKRKAWQQRVALELGGDGTAILAEDADWNQAILALAAGAFGYAGQTCISVQRILVHQSIYGSFRDAFLDHIRHQIQTGDPEDPNVVNGPLITEAARERVVEWVEEALAHGAKCATELKWEGPCLHPLVLENVPRGLRIDCQEAFAPVCVLEPFEEFSKALERVNASRYGLQTGLFTRRLDRVEEALETLEVGGLMVNRPPTFRLDNLPYGGVKESGVGREGVRYAMREMTEARTLVVDPLTGQ